MHDLKEIKQDSYPAKDPSPVFLSLVLTFLINNSVYNIDIKA